MLAGNIGFERWAWLWLGVHLKSLRLSSSAMPEVQHVTRTERSGAGGRCMSSWLYVTVCTPAGGFPFD
jgi:hypothetical protein